uniref:HMG box domain-containing protein n=1 Tax=Ciona savignyi TaxID=51511 RepID=H2ZJ48_CIOSA
APSTMMYMNSQYNHPACNKLLLGPNLSRDGKHLSSSSAVPKAPKAPEKPLMAYMRYSKKVWDEVKAGQPELKIWEIGKIIGKMWRELPSADKQVFNAEYESEKGEYQDLMKSYHNSPAYQSYLQAKGRADVIEAENRALERDESCISIEPADDGAGDTDEGFSVKHVAAARFQRNHRLMQDILTEPTIVPTGRSIVTQQRYDILKNQVQSLQKHQQKLQDELEDIERSHAGTKRKWKQQGTKFESEMKILKTITPQEFYVEYKKKQEQQRLLREEMEKKNKEEMEAKAEEERKLAEKAAEQKEGEEGEIEKKESIEEEKEEGDCKNIKELKQETEEMEINQTNEDSKEEKVAETEEMEDIGHEKEINSKEPTEEKQVDKNKE